MSESDFIWGEFLQSTEHFGRETDPSKYVKIDPNDEKYKDFTHCAHVLIFARSEGKAFNMYDRRAIVLMQMRYDGYLGFPGGLVDSGETPLEAANRELTEEMNWKPKYGTIKNTHHQFTHWCPQHQLILHFYALEVKPKFIRDIELGCLKTHDYGLEVLGVIRVPLYTMENGLGFPCFLRNNFLGSSRVQLLTTLVTLKVLDKDYVDKVLRLEAPGPVLGTRPSNL